MNTLSSHHVARCLGDKHVCKYVFNIPVLEEVVEPPCLLLWIRDGLRRREAENWVSFVLLSLHTLILKGHLGLHSRRSAMNLLDSDFLFLDSSVNSLNHSWMKVSARGLLPLLGLFLCRYLCWTEGGDHLCLPNSWNFIYLDYFWKIFQRLRRLLLKRRLRLNLKATDKWRSSLAMDGLLFWSWLDSYCCQFLCFIKRPEAIESICRFS